jgi:hypothetical protein
LSDEHFSVDGTLIEAWASPFPSQTITWASTWTARESGIPSE